MFTPLAPTLEVLIPALVASAPFTPITVKLERYSLASGANPGQLGFSLPITAVTGLSCTGNSVYVFRNGLEIFAGTIVEDDGLMARGQQDLRCMALDMRHELNAKSIGQYGIGTVATYGGWPGIGYDIQFNKDGKPNRSPLASTSPVSAGLYSFDTTTAATYWSFADILAWIFYWYVDADVFKLDQSLLLGPYTENAPEIDIRNLRIGNAIDFVTKTLGGTWFPYYSTTLAAATTASDYAPTYWPLHSLLTPSAAQSRTLFVDDGQNLYQPTEYFADHISYRHKATDSYDRLEVQSAPCVVETTYSDYGTSPLLTRFSTATELPDGDICYFDVNVANYLANGLGPNLTAASKPKRWHGRLVTRRDSSGYVAGPLTLADTGDDISALECFQLSNDSGATWKRVKSGIRIDLNQNRVYVSKKGSYYGTTKNAGAESYTLTDSSTVRIKLTISTIIEFPIIVETTVASWYLARNRTRRILRRDFVPLYRINSEVPDLTSSNPNTFTTLATGTTVTAYRDPTTAMEKLRDRIFAARNELEVTFACNLPIMPVINLGDAVTTWPLALWTTNQPVRVLRLDYDPERLDLRIQATNNIDGDYS